MRCSAASMRGRRSLFLSRRRGTRRHRGLQTGAADSPSPEAHGRRRIERRRVERKGYRLVSQRTSPHPVPEVPVHMPSNSSPFGATATLPSIGARAQSLLPPLGAVERSVSAARQLRRTGRGKEGSACVPSSARGRRGPSLGGDCVPLSPPVGFDDYRVAAPPRDRDGPTSPDIPPLSLVSRAQRLRLTRLPPPPARPSGSAVSLEGVYPVVA